MYADGPAPYYTFVAKGIQGGEIEQWAEIKHAASPRPSSTREAPSPTTTQSAACTARRHDRQRPDLFAQAFVAYKRAVDPHGLLNPGVP